MMLALPAAVWADPPGAVETGPELLRYRQQVSAVRFQRMGDRAGLPPSARGRGRTGPIEAWVWPDGTIARYRRSVGRNVVEDHRFDPAGIPWATVTLEGGLATRAVVHQWPPVAVPLSDWTAVAVGPVEVRGPGEAVDGRWHGAGGALRADWLPGSAEPASPRFAEGFAEGCGCLLSERTTALLDGRPGVSWRIDIPHPTAPEIGEVWVFSVEDGVLVLGWSAPRTADPVHPELAPGRAALAALRWIRP